MLRLPCYSVHHACYLCEANCTTMPWTQCSHTASWWASVHKDAAVWARGRVLNPLFETVGLSAFSVFPDWLHIKHLGVDHHLYASVLCYMASGDDDWQWLFTQLRAKYEAAGNETHLSFCCHVCFFPVRDRPARLRARRIGSAPSRKRWPLTKTALSPR